MFLHKILLIDLSAVLHILKHSNQTIKKNELSSYIIHSFLFRLQLIVKKVNPTVCVFATDTNPNDSKRRKLFPDYKKKRQTNKTQKQIELDSIAYPQFTEIEKKLLPLLGYKNIFKAQGLEADDIIAKICKDNPNSEIFIVSNDQDLYQLLTNTVCILNAKSLKFYTKNHFIKEYTIEPFQWKKVKSVGGCRTDGVPGIPGIGEKTIIKYINGELKPHLQSYQRIKDPNNFDLIMRNKKLTVLPFEGTPSYKIDFENKPTKKGIQKVGEKYNFLPIKKDFKYWCKTLRGY